MAGSGWELGLGAASVGISGFTLVGLPLVTILLAVAGQVLRRQRLSAAIVPGALGGSAALVGVLWASTTIQ